MGAAGAAGPNAITASTTIASGVIPWSALKRNARGAVDGSGADLDLNAQRVVYTRLNNAGQTVSTTLDGTFCAATAASYPGNIVIDAGASAGTAGYRAAKILCETACNSPLAHMCSLDEMTNSAQLGIGPNNTYVNGWVRGGSRVFSENTTVSNGVSTTTYYSFNECAGWTNSSSSSTSGNYGTAFGISTTNGVVDSAFPDWWTCDTTFPVLCCR